MFTDNAEIKTHSCNLSMFVHRSLTIANTGGWLLGYNLFINNAYRAFITPKRTSYLHIKLKAFNRIVSTQYTLYLIEMIIIVYLKGYLFIWSKYFYDY